MAGATPQARVADQLHELHNLFTQSQDYVDCIEKIKSGSTATFDSVWGSSCALFASGLLQQFSSVLLIFPQDKLCDDFSDDFSTFHGGTLLRFPHYLQSFDSRPTVDYEYGDLSLIHISEPTRPY